LFKCEDNLPKVRRIAKAGKRRHLVSFSATQSLGFLIQCRSMKPGESAAEVERPADPTLARRIGLFFLTAYGVGDIVGSGIYGTTAWPPERWATPSGWPLSPPWSRPC